MQRRLFIWIALAVAFTFVYFQNHTTSRFANGIAAPAGLPTAGDLPVRAQ